MHETKWLDWWEARRADEIGNQAQTPAKIQNELQIMDASDRVSLDSASGFTQSRLGWVLLPNAEHLADVPTPLGLPCTGIHCDCRGAPLGSVVGVKATRRSLMGIRPADR